MILSELTEVITKLKILKTHNFTDYGFPESYGSDVIFRTLGNFLQQCAMDNGTGFEYFQLFEDMNELNAILKDSSNIENNSEDSKYDLVEEVVCDDCGKEILETHYHCGDCKDFDL
jgi:hypothetical protein